MDRTPRRSERINTSPTRWQGQNVARMERHRDRALRQDTAEKQKLASQKDDQSVLSSASSSASTNFIATPKNQKSRVDRLAQNVLHLDNKVRLQEEKWNVQSTVDRQQYADNLQRLEDKMLKRIEEKMESLEDKMIKRIEGKMEIMMEKFSERVTTQVEQIAERAVQNKIKDTLVAKSTDSIIEKIKHSNLMNSIVSDIAEKSDGLEGKIMHMVAEKHYPKIEKEIKTKINNISANAILLLANETSILRKHVEKGVTAGESFNKFTKDIEEKQKNIESVNSDLSKICTANKNSMETLREDIRDQENNIAKLNASLQQQIHNKDNTVRELQEMESKNKIFCEKSAQDVQQLESTINNVHERFKTVESKYETVGEDLAQLESKYETVRDNIFKSSDKIDTAEGHLNKLKKDIAVVKKESQDTKSKLSTKTNATIRTKQERTKNKQTKKRKNRKNRNESDSQEDNETGDDSEDNSIDNNSEAYDGAPDGGGSDPSDSDDSGDSYSNHRRKNKPPRNAAYSFSTQNFEKFMKQDICLQKLTRPHIYLFYNKLKHLCEKYGILLKPLHKLKRDEPIHSAADYIQGKLLRDMSAELYHKLESDGCLPRSNNKIDSMVVSYGYNYDGFNLLKQILRPYCPTLQDGTRPQMPTWESSEKNVYVLQVFLQTFYTSEKSMQREFPEAQKSIDFLNEVMKSNKYKANAKIFKDKIMDRGINKAPPSNLSINEIATTLDAEVADDDDEVEMDAFTNRLTRSGTPFRPQSDTSSTPCSGDINQFQQRERNNRTRDRQNQLPPPLNPPSGDPSFVFRPTRTNQQCTACKKWGTQATTALLCVKCSGQPIL